jgi:hypothetical protein
MGRFWRPLPGLKLLFCAFSPDFGRPKPAFIRGYHASIPSGSYAVAFTDFHAIVTHTLEPALFKTKYKLEFFSKS